MAADLTDQEIARQLRTLAKAVEARADGNAVPDDPLFETFERMLELADQLDMHRLPKVVCQQGQPAPSGQQECDQCGWKPSAAWTSEHCGSLPFGSCDGTVVAALAHPSSSLDTLIELRRLEEELRTMAMVAGQASVEGPYTDRSAADAMFASYCSAWANRLATVLARVPAQPESEQ